MDVITFILKSHNTKKKKKSVKLVSFSLNIFVTTFQKSIASA